MHTAVMEPVRRLEVFTGAGRRRKWSDEDKARIVAEIVASGVFGVFSGPTAWIVAAAVVWLATLVARSAGRHSEADKVQFVPAVVDAVVPAPAAQERKLVRKADSGIIEIEVDGITIRAGRGADTTMIASIVRSPKTSR
ncbi:IS66-like element accessory protein TnpA [Bradyrhizobium pachyrhizi]|uniref:IS66-like element accessory protein TnpA n=1 Tax=Bradyrhizobium pachyrhizi TaxID=280333 RepID=UPI003D36094C